MGLPVFKTFCSFEVREYEVIISMKDELGESVKHVFNKGEEASVEVGVITNDDTDLYTFVGTVDNSVGTTLENITATNLNNNNSYVNRYTFTLDAISFPVGRYSVGVNVSKIGGGTVEASTTFQVRSWNLVVKKRDVNSGFEYEYSAFPNNTLKFEIVPTFRANGSTITNINTTTSINVGKTGIKIHMEINLPQILKMMSESFLKPNGSNRSFCGEAASKRLKMV